jgi:hypothetical protein
MTLRVLRRLGVYRHSQSHGQGDSVGRRPARRGAGRDCEGCTREGCACASSGREGHACSSDGREGTQRPAPLASRIQTLGRF